MKKIFLIGRATGSHRAVFLFEWLLKNGADYSVSYYDPSYLTPRKRTLFMRGVFRILRAARSWTRLFDLVTSSFIVVLPMATGFPIWYLKLARYLNIPVLTDFYISHFDTQVNDRKNIRPDSVKATKLRNFDKKLIQHSTTCIFLNASERDYYMSIAGESNIEKTKIIPLCVPERKKALLGFFNSQREIIHICWWGTYIPLHGLEQIIKASSVLKAEGVGHHLYILGTSDEKARPYKELVHSLGLSDYVTIRNDLRYADGSLPAFLQEECDVALGAFGSSRKARTVLVNKILEALSMQIPVITQPSEGVLEFLEPGRDLETVEPTPEGIADGIKKFYSAPQYAIDVSKNGYARYQEFFTPERFLAEFTKLLKTKDEDKQKSKAQNDKP
jgi:glycosyltransferase involved in cell wall biosynthesis